MMTKRILRPLQFAAVAVLVIVCGPAPRMRAQSHDQHPAGLGSVLSLEQKAQQNAFIRAVREATQPYQTADMLPRDYQLLFGCVSGGDFGAMGMHYVNLNLVGDGEITISKPEIMLYEPVAGGRPKLTGQHLEECALAGAVGSDEATQLARPELEVDAGHGPHTTEAALESAGLKDDILLAHAARRPNKRSRA